MQHWSQFVDSTQSLERDTFLTTYNYPFFLADIYFPKDAPPVDEDEGGPTWLIPLDPQKGKQPDRLTMGRNTENDILINHESISDQHATFFGFEQDLWFIHDSESSTGTFVNEDQVEAGEKLPLKNGDNVSLGDGLKATLFSPEALYDYVQLWKVLQQPASENARIPIRSWTFEDFARTCSQLGRQSFFSFYDRPFIVQQEEFRWPSEELDETQPMEMEQIPVDLDKITPKMIYFFPSNNYRVGRVSGDLVLRHPSVSSLHAAFINITSARGTLTDLGSKNGTTVNDWPVPAHTSVPLIDQDQFKIGGVPFTFMVPETLFDFCMAIAKQLGFSLDNEV